MDQDYENIEKISGAKVVKKNFCRAAVILLSLLCLLLLIGLTALAFLFIQGRSQEKKMGLLHNSLSREKNESQTICSNLKQEKDQLQTRNSNLVKDRIRLQKALEDMTKQRNDLQGKIEDCQQKWIYFNSSFYYISANMKSWQESRQDCFQKDADLMIINSQEEQNFANQFKKHLWIGLTDSEKEGSWKWVDGTPMTTKYWNSQEPNGAGTENCGQIKNYNSQNSWNDETCSILHFWICEKRVSP